MKSYKKYRKGYVEHDIPANLTIVKITGKNILIASLPKLFVYKTCLWKYFMVLQQQFKHVSTASVLFPHKVIASILYANILKSLAVLVCPLNGGNKRHKVLSVSTILEWRRVIKIQACICKN